MSYAELGRLRGISAASAKRLSNRRRWAKQPGNDGTTRVAVPPAEAVPRETDAGDVPGDMSHIIKSLESAIAALREEQEHERAALKGQIDALQVALSAKDGELTAFGGMIDSFGTRLAAVEGERDRALADAAELRGVARKAEDDRAAAVVIADEAVRAAEALRQAETERRGQGRWARIRAAWRRE